MTPLYLALLGIDKSTTDSTTDASARPWILSLTSQLAHLLRKGAEKLEATSRSNSPTRPVDAEDKTNDGKTLSIISSKLPNATVDDNIVPYDAAPFPVSPAALASFFHYNYPSVSFLPPDNQPKTKDYSATDELKVQCVVRCRIPTEDRGVFYLHYYINNRDSEHHMAIVYGDDIKSKSLEAKRIGEGDFDRLARGASPLRLENGNVKMIVNGNADSNSISQESRAESEGDSQGDFQHASHDCPLVRIHSACYTGETVGSARCDCAEQLNAAMKRMEQEGRGVVVYLRQEGRGIGLADKMRAYNLQDQGHDTVNANLMLHLPADARTYEVAALILQDLDIDTVRLMTNNPDKIQGLEKGGIKIVERQSMVPDKWQKMMSELVETDALIKPNRSATPLGSTTETPEELKELDNYLLTKIQRMGHQLQVPDEILRLATPSLPST